MKLYSIMLFSLITCASPFAPPAGAVRFSPPSWYQDMYKHDLECSNLSGYHRQYDDIKWYWISGESFKSLDNSVAAGEEGSENIVIAGNYLAHPMVIRHEIMHYLLEPAHSHIPKYFDGECLLLWKNYATPEDTAMFWEDYNAILNYKNTHNGKLGLPNGE